MTTTPTAQRIAGATPAPGRAPAGVRMSNVWQAPDGTMVKGAAGVEVPVDKEWRICGWLWLCQDPTCQTAVWVYTEDGRPEQEYCGRDGLQLIPAEVTGKDPDVFGAARTVAQSRLRDLLVARRQKAFDAAAAKADALREEAADLARRTVNELWGHLPSAAVSTTGLLAGIWVRAEHGPWITAVAGLTASTVGVVAAYSAVYVVERVRAQFDGVDPADLRGKKGRAMRQLARRVAAGVAALGGWLLAAAACGVDPGTVPGAAALLAGTGLVWAVNRAHWDKLWADRRRLAELARLAAEEAERRAREEAERLARLNQPSIVDETDPAVVGARMAAEWARIGQDPTVPVGFDMKRTRIVPGETRRLEIPGRDGRNIGYGWEFIISADPGVLVSRMNAGSPLVAARDWLASMLDRDVTTTELAWVPARPNRGSLTLTDGLALAGEVGWKGPSGIRRTEDGAVFAHIGRALTLEDVEEPLYVPGQPSGGLTIGTTGAGKSAAQRVRFLNLLAAGIFPCLHDPKEFEDYIDFIGVFPMVYTTEQRDVLLAALHAERVRRAKLKTTAPRTDRHGRARTGEPVWNLRNGPPIRSVWDEFHMNVRDERFTSSLTELVRTQRSTAISADILTQGGGLADLADSNLRDLVAKVRSTFYRVSDHLARLAGYEGEYSPAKLPSLPGVCLMVAEGVPPVPMRSAYVTREDVDGEVYDYLYAPDMSPLLTAPVLPPETLDVFESTGLMDLWRLGQGPNGAERLLSSTNTPDLAPVAAANGRVTAGPKPKADNVVLAVLHAEGGLELATEVCSHAAWVAAPGWGKSPSLSTVTRALTALSRDGLVTARPDGKQVITAAGVDRAKAWAEALGLVGSDLPLPPAVVAERDAERRREDRLQAENRAPV